MTSLPSWERGLKLHIKQAKLYRLLVAPLVGAWIEILIFVPLYPPPRSLPSWERGLKYSTDGIENICIWSLPSWERGLKSKAYGRIVEPLTVAPLVGAWIEIAGAMNLYLHG